MVPSTSLHKNGRQWEARSISILNECLKPCTILTLSISLDVLDPDIVLNWSAKVLANLHPQKKYFFKNSQKILEDMKCGRTAAECIEG